MGIKGLSSFNFLVVCFLAVLLTGCSASFAPSATSVGQTPIGNIQGSVQGGQAPITGSQIYLFAAGTGGYGTNATSLITSGKPGVTCNAASGMSYPALNGACYVTTDANGNFSVTGDYTCTAGQQVYMVAMGGNPGQTGTVNNTAIVQMAPLGQCPAAGNLATQVPSLVINEVTTVTFAYAMGGFATNAFNVSTDATGTTAIANAMANAKNIANLRYGQAPTAVHGNSNSINPQSKIYTLANILSTCVNTSSSTSTQCTNLFKYATTSTGTVAADEANAIFNIVHNQAQNVANLWSLIPTTPVFTPTLSAQPSDWTLPVIYTGVVSVPASNGTTKISGPFNIAFDASGNAWIGDRGKGVVEVGPQGAVTTINNGFGMVKGVAISPADGNIWVSDYNSNDIYVMNSSGTKITSLTTDMNGPIMTAFSLNNATGDYFAYAANETTTGIVLFDANKYTLQYFGNTNFTNVGTPGWISVDQAGTAWLPSTNSAYVGTLTVTQVGSSNTYATAQASGAAQAYTTAVDSNGNIWLGNTASGANALVELPGGSTLLPSSHTGGGVNGPNKLAVDGANNIWVTNVNANTVSGWSQTLNTTGGWMASAGFNTSAPGGTGCQFAAPDPSGNLWAANSDGSVSELLGLATPTAAPLYGGNGVKKGNLGTKP